jgi:dephospho-CoA kinase
VVPLLFETRGYLDRVSRVLVVDCPEALQASRTAARSGLATAEVRAIMAAQWPRWRRLQLADDVIWNGGTEAELAPQCARMHATYLGNAGADGPQSPPTQRGAR